MYDVLLQIRDAIRSQADTLRAMSEALHAIHHQLDILIGALYPGRPVDTTVRLGSPLTPLGGLNLSRKLMNARRSKIGAPAPIPIAQLGTEGALLEALDALGNVVSGGIDPAATTVTWTVSDPTVATISFANPADTTMATITTTGKACPSFTVTATPSNNDGSTPLPPATSDPMSVAAGQAVSTTILLGPTAQKSKP